MNGNNSCFDCNEAYPEWASVNNGILICYKCAGIHRAFGRKISLVASIILDEFDRELASLLLQGGNDNFALFLSKYDIQRSDSLDLKYKSRASQWYRVWLQNKVRNEQLPKELPIELGRELIIVKLEENVENKEFVGSQPQVEEEEEEQGFFGALRKGFSKAGKAIVETSQVVNKTMDEYGVTSALNKGATFVTEKTEAVYVIF